MKKTECNSQNSIPENYTKERDESHNKEDYNQHITLNKIGNKEYEEIQGRTWSNTLKNAKAPKQQKH